MPLLWDQAHSVLTVKHCIEKIGDTVAFFNPGQTPVITADQPLCSFQANSMAVAYYTWWRWICDYAWWSSYRDGCVKISWNLIARQWMDQCYYWSRCSIIWNSGFISTCFKCDQDVPCTPDHSMQPVHFNKRGLQRLLFRKPWQTDTVFWRMVWFLQHESAQCQFWNLVLDVKKSWSSANVNCFWSRHKCTKDTSPWDCHCFGTTENFWHSFLPLIHLMRYCFFILWQGESCMAHLGCLWWGVWHIHKA